MSSQKPSLPKGTRDFGPEVMGQRTYLLDTIKQVFQKFGFQPLETPSMEKLSVLTGKYGDEGDQLLFKVLDSGDFLSGTTEADYQEGTRSLLPKIAEKGLRYDLTVPFARYVVMNQHEITFPFRRYQVQPVWRADRPQRGRYREFYQCDADVVGTDALLCEAEIILMLEEVFAQLKLTDLPTGQAGYTIKINDRRLLHGLVEVLGVPDKETDLLVAIDKLDKIGEEKVLDELRQRGFSEQAIGQLKPVFSLTGSNLEQLNEVSRLLADSEVGQEGIAALREVMETARALGSSLEHLSFDLTLARGLSYYTGAIFEVKSNQGSLRSSISGGGRYDNLTGGFGLPGVSGVGISFGVDRIYDVLDELGLFPEASQVSTQVLFVNFDRSLEAKVLPLLSQVRRAGIAAELYPEAVKMKKQFAYADKKGIPYAVVVGTNELASGQYGLKNLRTGEQEALSLAAIIERVKQ